MPDTLTKTCPDCGNESTLEIPKPIQGTKWEAVLRGLNVTCDDCAARQEAEETKREQERLESEKAEQLRHRLAKSGMPPLLARVTFEDLDVDDNNRAAIETARKWSEGQFPGLLLAGDVGVGKTWIAAAAVNARLRRHAMRWFVTPRLLLQARAGFKHAAREEATDLLLSPSLGLALDDIDKSNPTDFTLDLLFQAVDERITHQAPLLVTTNMGAVELAQHLSEALVSRLSSYCKVHRIEGKDRRQQA